MKRELSLQEKLEVFDEPKITILQALYDCYKQPYGCELVNSLYMPKSLLSYHLKILIDKGYVEFTRKGRKKHYKITAVKRHKVRQILKTLDLIERRKSR